MYFCETQFFSIFYIDDIFKTTIYILFIITVYPKRNNFTIQSLFFLFTRIWKKIQSQKIYGKLDLLEHESLDLTFDVFNINEYIKVNIKLNTGKYIQA